MCMYDILRVTILFLSYLILLVGQGNIIWPVKKSTRCVHVFDRPGGLI